MYFLFFLRCGYPIVKISVHNRALLQLLKLKLSILSLAKNIADRYGLKIKISYFFPPDPIYCFFFALFLF